MKSCSSSSPNDQIIYNVVKSVITNSSLSSNSLFWTDVSFQCLNCHCIIVKSSITFANFFEKFCDFLHKIIAMRRSWLPCSHLYFYVTRLMWLRAQASRQERNSKCWITRRQDLCITFWSMMHHPMLNQVVLQKLLDNDLYVMFVLYENCLSRQHLFSKDVWQ